MVCYRDISFNEVSKIKEVWERNRKFHEEISKIFSNLYSDIVFLPLKEIMDSHKLFML